MGSVIDHRLDYTGEEALRGQRHIWQRAVSYFSLLSYYTQNLSTQAAKLLAVRNEHVSPKRKKKRLLTFLFCLGTTKLSRLFLFNQLNASNLKRLLNRTWTTENITLSLNPVRLPWICFSWGNVQQFPSVNILKSFITEITAWFAIVCSCLWRVTMFIACNLTTD